MDTGTIGHQQRAGLGQIDAVGDLEQALRGDRDLLLQPAIADPAHHPVADRKALGAFAQRLDSARDFSSRGERPGGLELVHVADDQRVGEVDRAGRDLDQHLAGARFGLGDLLDDQRFGTTGFFGQYGLHNEFSLGLSSHGSEAARLVS